jgi:hypothetical protein
MFRLLAKLLGVVVVVSIGGAAASALAALNLKKKATPRPDEAADEIDFVTVMDGAEFASTAASFRGGRVVCWYAGVDLDLRDARLDAAGASLEVRTVFGGTRIVVAPGTPVRVSGPAIFGGVQSSVGAPETTAETPGLEITGFTLFGGLQVIASEPGEEIPGWTGEHDHQHDDEHPDELPAPSLEMTPDVEPA